ncbi:hypothetical protein Tco_1073610 [Tanacetum coccineum]
MKMVPYEAFACRCGAGDVVLRESLRKITLDVTFFMERGTSSSTDQFSWSFIDSYFFSRNSIDCNFSRRPSTPPVYSGGSSRNGECSNYKLLLARIKILEAQVEMYMHPEQHTLNSTSLLYEVYNDMGKLGLE